MIKLVDLQFGDKDCSEVVGSDLDLIIIKINILNEAVRELQRRKPSEISERCYTISDLKQLWEDWGSSPLGMDKIDTDRTITAITYDRVLNFINWISNKEKND